MVMARNASLPEEVVEEILMKLPVKSLKRFRCVCKSWLSSIDSPDFVKMHYQNSHNLNALVMSMPDLGSQVELKVQISLLCSETMSVREKLYIPYREIIGECHGLVLLVDYSKAGLLNPATNEFKLIPQSTVPEFDPYGAYQFIWGFGYDRSSHDYKILHFGIHHKAKMQICLYSLNASSWREIRYPFESKPGALQSGIYVNGRCHWWLDCGKTILAFDMAEESFHIMDFFLGDDVFDSYCLLKLRVIDNCLACSVELNEDFGCFKIWVMKDYEVKDSWTKQLVIGPIRQAEALLGMWKTGEWFLTMSLGRLAMYNPQTMAVRHLGMQRLRYPGFQTVIYTESLYSLNGTYLNPIYDSDVHHPNIMDPLEESRNV